MCDEFLTHLLRPNLPGTVAREAEQRIQLHLPRTHKVKPFTAENGSRQLRQDQKCSLIGEMRKVVTNT